jgi:hypothetical protein
LWLWDGIATVYVIGGASVISLLGLLKTDTKQQQAQEEAPDSPRRLAYLAEIFLLLLWLAAAWLVVKGILTSATSEPIRSPWAVLPVYITTAFAIATAALVTLSTITKRSWPLALWSIHGSIVTGLAWLTYRAGYGFDPFIHQATERLLLANGTFSPAPPYYLGQYTLVTALQRLSHLPLESIDRALVPLTAGILLPCLAYWILRRNFRTKINIALLTAGAVLALPLSAFIMTSPHALALLFGLVAVGGAVFFLEQKRSAITMIIAALAAIGTHPLVGVPIATFVLLVITWRHVDHSIINKIGFWVLWVLAPFSVLAMFVFNGLINPANGAQISLNGSAGLSLISNWLLPKSVTMFDLRDAAYPYLFNLPVLGFILVITSLWFLWRRGRLHRLVVLALAAVATILGAVILTSTLRLDFLIDYERGAFADRLLLVATIIASPLVLLALYRLLKRLQARGVVGNAILITLLTGAISMAFFLTYPSFDQYRKDRGYNTARVDFDTVQRIEADAAGKPYVVLANQATAAAAVNVIGFSRSYKDNYFYPLPTGSPLYQLYLDFVYKGPSLGTISKVRELTGVQLVYVAVSSYWDSFDRIRREAQATTPRWFTVGTTSTVDVFRYD